MEHIPPDRVNAVLDVIKRSVRRAALFEINLKVDWRGDLIGNRLHLSVHPADWWQATRSRFWRNVQLVREEKRGSATFIVRNETGGAGLLHKLAKKFGAPSD